MNYETGWSGVGMLIFLIILAIIIVKSIVLNDNSCNACENSYICKDKDSQCDFGYE